MATKGDLEDRLQEAQEACEAAADLLSDPEMDDRSARVEALEHLGFRPPAFLFEPDPEEGWGGEEDEYDDEDWEDDEE